MATLVDGFGFSGYRSFDAPCELPLAGMTLLAGPNNAGKSNVLKFLCGPFAESVKRPGVALSLGQLDRCIGGAGATSRCFCCGQG